MKPRLNKWTQVALLLFWLGAITVGLCFLESRAGTPGKSALAPSDWPRGSRLQLDPQQPTLIMFAHPQCPCTRASLGELALLMAHHTGRVKAYVLFYQPAEQSEEWVQTDQWRSAAEIAGVTVLADYEGHETRRFQAMTSGQTLLFDTHGQLIFSGGITMARGHAGDNAGRSAIEEYLSSGKIPVPQTPVFGCAILDEPGQ